jgi:hypothetical protein
MDRQPHPSHLPWLDRMTARVPGYAGYGTPTQRRAAAHALRDALARHLTTLRTQLDEALADCRRREAHSEIPAVERVAAHVERILHRLRGFGTSEPFYSAPSLRPGQVDPIYAIDHAALDTAERLTHYFDVADPSHNRLAAIEAGLKALEHTLDERAMLMRAV